MAMSVIPLYCNTHLFQCTNTSLAFPEDGQTQPYKSKFSFPKKIILNKTKNDSYGF